MRCSESSLPRGPLAGLRGRASLFYLAQIPRPRPCRPVWFCCGCESQIDEETGCRDWTYAGKSPFSKQTFGTHPRLSVELKLCPRVGSRSRCCLLYTSPSPRDGL